MRWLAILGICIGVSVIAIDFAIVNTALPSIQKGLSITLGELQWVMNAFGIALVSFLVTMGRLGDRVGLKKMFLFGQLIFWIASLISGLAPNGLWLIFGRFLQGTGAAALLPLSIALITTVFPPEQKARGVGIWSAIIGIGMVMGPVLGGVIVNWLSWRWIFLVNLPIIAISAFLSIIAIRSEDRKGGIPVDWLGLLFLTLGIGCLVTGIVQSPIWGWSSLWTLLSLSLGLVALVVLVLIEQRVKHPILPFRLLLNRMFLSCATANFSMIFFAWATFFLIPLYLYSILDRGPLNVGVTMLFISLPLAILSPICGRYASRTGPKILITSSFVALITSAFLMALFGKETSQPFLIIALLTNGVGYGLGWSVSIAYAVSTLPKRLAATAAGAFTTLQEMGGSLGLAISGALFRTVDRRALTELPSNVSESTRHLVKSLLSDPEKAKEKLGGMGHLFDLFENAFVTSFQTTLWFLCAFLVVSIIIIALLMPRGKQSTVHPEDMVES